MVSRQWSKRGASSVLLRPTIHPPENRSGSGSGASSSDSWAAGEDLLRRCASVTVSQGQLGATVQRGSGSTI